MTAADLDAYRSIRHGVAAVPAGRDVVLVAGTDAPAYLQGQCSQDVEGLDPGRSADALLLTPQGKLQALVRVTRLDDQRFVVDVDAGHGDAVVARLLRFRLRVQVEVSPLPWRCVALRGPGAAALVPGGRTLPGTEVVVPFDWGGLVGVDLLGPAPVVPDGVATAPAAAWEAARVEAGVPRMGAELDERTIAAEAGLVERAVSFTKGCYTGQELVARLDARGSRVARHLRGVVLDPATAAGPGAPAAGWTVVAGGRAVGALTSVAHSPALGRPVALAYVHRDVTPPAPVVVVPAGDGVPADAATGGVPGEVRLLPLVPTADGGPAGPGDDPRAGPDRTDR